ncbi:MAG: DUF1269 domain-containing protein [Betaproteobacteria bacterium RIFCSPLOWO2_02_67_12]|nr:MAG: DUF1269 domain-containing protein [Betaproteobacteria bacterium RIFCSPLOWO2_02_67_12]OGA27502.1 MAG: DUF1269 domain-containing protein [Betaproteobacteria bacterium RIFCSPLOWO2_02_FULL_68_150]OGA66132.1 MAG: DUF1269 domain-containing protein [Betaproteobacteria bacterium RIFCSPLOWO2_12_FULL_67_28]
MKRRLYFVLPDLGSAIRTANDLLLARVEDRYMHFLAKRGMSLGELHEANYFQKSDLRHSMQVGFILGGCAGFLVGIYIYMTPPEGTNLQLVTILIATVVGAVFGAWAASMIGISTPNTALKRFEAEIGEGRVLLMVDVPKGRVEEIQELVHRSHPEASDHGLEPTMPAFP